MEEQAKQIAELKQTLKDEAKTAAEKYAALHKQHDIQTKENKTEIQKYADKKI